MKSKVNLSDEEIKYNCENGILASMQLSNCLMYAFSKILTEDNFTDENNKQMFSLLKKKILSEQYKNFIYKSDVRRIETATHAIDNGAVKDEDFKDKTSDPSDIYEYLKEHVESFINLIKMVCLDGENKYNLYKSVNLMINFMDEIYNCLNIQYPIEEKGSSFCRFDAIKTIYTLFKDVFNNFEYYNAIKGSVRGKESK